MLLGNLDGFQYVSLMWLSRFSLFSFSQYYADMIIHWDFKSNEFLKEYCFANLDMIAKLGEKILPFLVLMMLTSTNFDLFAFLL